tara:strand:+ start:1241 stop:1600 length:360 start_codon:yes stop_codon:yes gene_type:complete
MKLSELITDVNNEQSLHQAIGVLLDNLNKTHKEAWPTNSTTYTARQGKKYVKIISEGTQRSVWGFINLKNEKFNLGDILMASSWASPALNKARGNVFQDYPIEAKGRYSMRLYGPDYLI